MKKMNDNKGKRSKAQRKAEAAVESFVSQSSSKNDPFGSYTGHPENEKDKPVQDADDL
jgi:hypothetical protein